MVEARFEYLITKYPVTKYLVTSLMAGVMAQQALQGRGCRILAFFDAVLVPEFIRMSEAMASHWLGY